MEPIHDGEEEETGSMRNSTRSCPASFTPTRRAQFPRRSLKEMSLGLSGKLQPFVHRNNAALDLICEDSTFQTDSEEKPTAPPRARRPSYLPSTFRPQDINDNRIEQLSPATVTSEKSVAERIEDSLHRHYYTIAYSIVLIAYLIGFAEYLYFRLVSLLVPDHTFHHPACKLRENLRIGKDGFHYGVSIAAFIAIAFFQLICFFGLTISENWVMCRWEYSSDDVIRKKHEIAAHIRKIIGHTMYRVFMCYSLCSFINCGIIFYMVGVQDSLGDTVSTVFLYVFDAVVILYFIAFPLTTIIYHPHVHCFQKDPALPVPPPGLVSSANPRSQSSTLESTISGLEEYVQSPRRYPRTTTVV